MHARVSVVFFFVFGASTLEWFWTSCGLCSTNWWQNDKSSTLFYYCCLNSHSDWHQIIDKLFNSIFRCFAKSLYTQVQDSKCTEPQIDLYRIYFFFFSSSYYKCRSMLTRQSYVKCYAKMLMITTHRQNRAISSIC